MPLQGDLILNFTLGVALGYVLAGPSDRWLVRTKNSCPIHDNYM